MGEQLTVTFRDVPITYRERENVWRFVLRGRERTAGSLKEAKEIIGKPAPKKGKPFQKFEAWYVCGHSIESVTVLFVANGASWRSERQVRARFLSESRLTSQNDERNVDVTNVYPKNAHNDALATRIQDLRASIEKAEADMDAAREKMKCYVPAVEDEAAAVREEKARER
jgi:outer membrane murein-binding lipoprotein Lpp